MNQLYPLKFTPIIKDKIWGGSKLKNILNKPTNSDNAGESWEISGVQGDISVASNGFLEGNNLEELIEIYMGDLVGQKVYEKFGVEFPLLIKFIDATDDLSIQVHPDDKAANERHNSFGKTEMWYIMQADENASLIVGFKEDASKEIYTEKLNQNKLDDILNYEHVKEGDVFFLPAGRIHAICGGNLLAEIQQTSDITYRIYDYNRKDKDGNTRELHIDMAVDVIDFKAKESYKTEYQPEKNNIVNLEKCQYFTTNLLELDKSIDKDMNQIDSFKIYMCLEGKVTVGYNSTEKIELSKGETLLIPAEIENYQLIVVSQAKLLEVYIEDDIKIHAN